MARRTSRHNAYDGSLAAFLVAGESWNRLGATAMPEGLSWEQMCDHAGLNFTVDTAPVEYHLPSGEQRGDTGHRVVFREDSGKALGVVGSRYTPSQNRDTIYRLGAEFARQGATPANVGVWDDGASFWGMLATGDGITIPGDDSIVQGFLFITSSHDGTIPTQVRSMMLRLACANQFDLALLSGVRRFRAKHTLTAPTRVEDYARALAAVADDLAKFGEMAAALAAVPFDSDKWRTVADALFPLPVDDSGAVKKEGVLLRRAQDAQEAFLSLRGGTTVRGGMEDSAWGAFNAAGEAFDHLLGVSVNTDKRNLDPQSAFTRTLAGGRTPDKARALRVVAEVAGVSI